MKNRSSVGLALVLAASALSGCSPVKNEATGPVIQAAASDGYGLGAKVGELDKVVWAADLCGNAPGARVVSLDWKSNEGVRIVDFSVVNQPAGEDQIGSIDGTLDELNTSPEGTENRTVKATCRGKTQTNILSSVLLQVRLSDGFVVGRAEGLVIHGSHGEKVVKPFTLVLCPDDGRACGKDRQVERS